MEVYDIVLEFNNKLAELMACKVCARAWQLGVCRSWHARCVNVHGRVLSVKGSWVFVAHGMLGVCMCMAGCVSVCVAVRFASLMVCKVCACAWR